MKHVFKTFGLHLGVFLVLALTLGIAYAAWDSTVNTGDQLTADSWNNLVNKVKTMDSNLSFSGGKVGIGTTNPGTKLELYGTNSAGSLLRLKNNATHYTEIIKRSASYQNPHAFSIYNNDGTNWHHGITVSAIGRVGIGTETPQAKLHVNGDIKANSFNGVNLFVKSGNNGTVSCDTFCQGSQWGNVQGACFGQKRISDGAYIPCGSIASTQVSCVCSSW